MARTLKSQPIEADKPLENPKQEKFCQFVAMGQGMATAYVNAGYSASGAKANGPRLAESATVAARISWLKSVKEAAAIESGIEFDAAMIDRELVMLSRASFADIIEKTGEVVVEEGEQPYEATRIKPLHEWPAEFMASVQAIKVKRRLVGPPKAQYEVELMEFKLHPKIAAIAELRKHRGYDETKGKDNLLGVIGVIGLPNLDPLEIPQFPEGAEIPAAFTIGARVTSGKVAGEESAIETIREQLRSMRHQRLLPRPSLAHQIMRGERDPIVVNARQPGDEDD
jgi:hypothetical protein